MCCAQRCPAAAGVILAVFSQFAAAETVIWSQEPDINANPYAPGSIVSTQRSVDDIVFAQDQPITALDWWGGTYNGDLVDTFRIRFYEDDGLGLPGIVVYEQDVMPTSSLTGVILPGSPGPEEYLFEADLPVVFTATAGTNYWLEVAGYFGPPEGAFGWSSSSSSFGDGNDAGVFWSFNFDKWMTGLPDRAFRLIVPEPSSFLLLAGGAAALLRRRIPAHRSA